MPAQDVGDLALGEANESSELGPSPASSFRYRASTALARGLGYRALLVFDLRDEPTYRGWEGRVFLQIAWDRPDGACLPPDVQTVAASASAV